MDDRSTILKKILETNDYDTNCLNQHVDNNNQVISTLELLSNQVEVNGMVVIGSKAMIPGRFYHTSEILVSCFEGYLVKCSTAEAISIINMRTSVAKQKMDALKLDSTNFRNKLELPISTGAFGNEMNITEHISVEEDLQWREQHRQNLKKFKQKEAEQRKLLLLDESSILNNLETIEDLNNELCEI